MPAKEKSSMEKLLEKNKELIDYLMNAIDVESQNPIGDNRYAVQLSPTGRGFRRVDTDIPPFLFERLVGCGFIKKFGPTTMPYYCVPYEVRECVMRMYKKNSDYEEYLKRPLDIPKDIFNCVEGMEDEIELCRRALVVEKPIGVLLVGPPATGKTIFLDEIARIPGAKRAVGTSAKRAGIIRFIVDERPRILLFDELDKLPPSDQTALLEVMESGRVTEMKTGRTGEIEINLRVFGGANTIDTLDEALKTRFWIRVLKEYTSDQYVRVVVKVLTMRENTNKAMAREIARSLIESGKKVTVRDAVRVARFVQNDDAMLEKAIKLL